MKPIENVWQELKRERTARRALARLLAAKGSAARNDPAHHDLVVEINMAEMAVNRAIEDAAK